MSSASTSSTVIARPIGKNGQTLVSVGDTHIVVGSAQISTTISKNHAPADFLLAALATDLLQCCRAEAQRLQIPLDSVTITVQGKLFASEGQYISVRFTLIGPDKRQSEQLAQAATLKAETYRLLGDWVAVTLQIV